MSRVIIVEGQAVSEDDFQNMQSLQEKELNDYLIRKLMRYQDAAYIEDSFLVARETTGSVRLKADRGIGWQLVTETNGKRPVIKRMLIEADVVAAITAADPTNNRYDILVTRPKVSELEDESRLTKNLVSGQITLVNRARFEKDIYEYQIIDGTPSGSPTQPATPSGWNKVASWLVTAAVGINSDNDVTDERSVIETVEEHEAKSDPHTQYAGDADITALEAAREKVFHTHVANISALQAITSSGRQNGQLIVVDSITSTLNGTESYVVYFWDSAESALSETDTLSRVTPTDVTEPAAGRWKRLDYYWRKRYHEADVSAESGEKSFSLGFPVLELSSVVFEETSTKEFRLLPYKRETGNENVGITVDLGDSALTGKIRAYRA